MSFSFVNKIFETGAGIIPFILVLTIIVFVHEFGHFLIARYNGVQVTKFSIGYGPEIFGWTDKKGTRWRFSAIPLGGYVMMLGDSDASSVKADLNGLKGDDLKKTVHSKPPLQRMMVAFGGPLANIIFTLSVLIFIGLFKGIPDMEPKIQAVLSDSIGEKCGLKEGDILVGINDKKIKLVSDIKKIISKFSGSDVILKYEREGKINEVKAALYDLDKDGRKTPLTMLGVSLGGEIVFTKVSTSQAVVYGLKYCYLSAQAFITGISKALLGKKDGAKIGGILSIGDIANKSIAGGFITFLNFMAMLSFSLAFFNLLPIPVLDGGSIVLNFIEFVRGKPLSNGVINFIYSLGIVAVASLMIWSTWNDISRYGDKLLDFFKGFFK